MTVLRAIGQSSQLRAIGRCHLLACQDLKSCSYLSPRLVNVWDYVQQLIDMDLWAKWSLVGRSNVRHDHECQRSLRCDWTVLPIWEFGLSMSFDPLGEMNPFTSGVKRILSWFRRNDSNEFHTCPKWLKYLN